jgi:putative SOS response-associated peptidase YedK
MCGRYSITLPPEAIRELFRTHGELPNRPAWYNAAPTTALPVVRRAKDGNRRELVLMTWGLIPWFSKDGKPSFSTINARTESLRTAASYKEPLAKGRRCLVPASGYFEWTGGSRTTSRALMDSPCRLLACGIAGETRTGQRRKRRSPSSKETFTIVTTEPSKFAAQFHDRMPLVLEPNTWETWLRGDPETAASLMKAANEDVLVSRPVNKAVGNVKDNAPELLESI